MSRSRPGAKPNRPVVVGEVLYDHFPDGRRALGGAPFNVAWNLRGLGLDPLFLSAVGDDDEGREIRERMRVWGLDDALLRTAGEAPTGAVRVSLDRGEPTYEILADRAYDLIEAPDAPPSGAAILYHGSLVWRSETTRRAILGLRETLDAPTFVDVNVRPGFQQAWLPELLEGAAHVKLNREELALVAGTELTDEGSIERAVAILRERFGCGDVWLTQGPAGASAFISAADGTNLAFHVEAPPVDVVDTVGAGDAFAAATIAGILAGDDPTATLRRAVRFAARVCGLRGAVTEDPGFYDAAGEVAATSIDD